MIVGIDGSGMKVSNIVDIRVGNEDLDERESGRGMIRDNASEKGLSRRAREVRQYKKKQGSKTEILGIPADKKRPIAQINWLRLLIDKL